MSFSWNPFAFAREVLKHLRRLAEVFPGSPGDDGWWLVLLALLSMAGLVIAAFKGGRRSETVAARYLLLLVVVAAGDSLVDRFPFGPSNDVPVSAGGRHTLWMVPALAVGLAALAHRARRLVSGWDPLRRGFDAIALTAAIAIVVAAYEPAPEAVSRVGVGGSLRRCLDTARGRGHRCRHQHLLVRHFDHDTSSCAGNPRPPGWLRSLVPRSAHQEHRSMGRGTKVSG